MYAWNPNLENFIDNFYDMQFFFSAFNRENDNDILDESIKGQWTVEPKFVMEMCDLALPMSASRRFLTSEPPEATPNFGTTVTVIVSNKEQQNLKSSLKKPKPVR